MEEMKEAEKKKTIFDILGDAFGYLTGKKTREAADELKDKEEEKEE